MPVIKAKNTNGEWVNVAAANNTSITTTGTLKYAVLEHNTGSTIALQYRTFDLTSYIPFGTIYFMTQYGSTAPNHYLCIIKNGVIEEVCYETDNGTIFQNPMNLATPTFELTNGIMKVTGATQSNLRDYADVIYVE